MAGATARPIVAYYSAFLKNVKSFSFLSLFCLFWIAVFVTFLRGKPVARRVTTLRKPRRLLSAAGGAEPFFIFLLSVVKWLRHLPFSTIRLL
ncbi:hypothetical protein [Oscillibacter sp.]|uniref:hypothetical protein n=1 Tax=Oscillibacter sp. TaxID=1945593 RepID=UPI00339784A7